VCKKKLSKRRNRLRVVESHLKCQEFSARFWVACKLNFYDLICWLWGAFKDLVDNVLNVERFWEKLDAYQDAKSIKYRNQINEAIKILVLWKVLRD
jgi:hypothetical protein